MNQLTLYATVVNLNLIKCQTNIAKFIYVQTQYVESDDVMFDRKVNRRPYGLVLGCQFM